jgi:hypothetical protein
MKTEKVVANLYMLLGDTLKMEDALVVVGSQEETTSIWHRRLGHMSERGLKVLAERNLIPGSSQ